MKFPRPQLVFRAVYHQESKRVGEGNLMQKLETKYSAEYQTSSSNQLDAGLVYRDTTAIY